MPHLLKRYSDSLKSKGFQPDAEQEKAVRSLQRLFNEIVKSEKKIFWPFSKKQEPIKGVYLHGGVGRGKSMLMDFFFAELPEKLKKRRVHFHEFMIETHDWLHKNRGKENIDDILAAYANYVADEVDILCFDEFHVTDVADAMILGRLFTSLFRQGVVVVSTSNWAPDDLYEGGLQRALFLPFIDLLKQRMDVVYLDNDKDYRLLADSDQDVYYFSPLNAQTEQKIQQLFEDMGDGQKVENEEITVKGRNIEVEAVNNIARFTFSQLCEQPHAAEDFNVIAKRYNTVFLENVPVLGAEKRNEAKRFILLIDCLYEAHCRLVLSAEADIHNLYSGDDHAFEFDRTVSRLMEMQSSAYHEQRLVV